MEIEAFTRKWGNSLAIVVPAHVVAQQKLKENQPVVVQITRRKVKAGELWGLLKDWKRSTDEILAEADKGWD
jgi:antitoxin component of MazEF toxin-antitoxin module